MMVVEAVALLVVLTALFGVIGFGVTYRLSPDLDGGRFLLVPAVGIGVLYLAAQWLTPFLASGLTLVIVLVVAGSYSVFTAVADRRNVRALLRAHRTEFGAVALAAGGAYLLLLIPLFHAGAFTLSGTIGDGLWNYAPAAAYMASHAYAAGSAPPFNTPALSVLEAIQAPLYPGSMGALEGGLSAVLGRPVHQLIDPVDACCLVLVLVSAYVFVSRVLGCSRQVAAMAVALAISNQFMVWTMDYTHVPEMRAAVLLAAGLVFVACALRGGSIGAAVLAGGIGAVLTAVYLPVFIVYAAGAAGATLVCIARSLLARRGGPWLRPAAAAAVTAAVIGALNARWLLFGGGLAAWKAQAFLSTPIPYGIPLPPQYLLGTAPFAELYRYEPLLFWNPAWGLVAKIAAAAVAIAGLAGLAALVRRGRGIEAGMFSAVVAFTLYVRLGTPGPYGWTKIFSYTLPVTAILVALGINEIARLSRRASSRLRQAARRRRRGSARGRLRLAASFAIPAAVLALVLAVQAAASVETDAMFIRMPEGLPATSLDMARLPAIIPPGTRTLLYDPALTVPGGSSSNTWPLRIAAYFLVNRDVTVPRDMFAAIAPNVDSFPVLTSAIPNDVALHYDFIVEPLSSPYPPPNAADFREVWAGAGLALFQREVPAAAH